MSDWLSQLFSGAAQRSFEQGQHLFRKDDAVTHVFLVLNGQIELTRITPAGSGIILEVAGEGDVLAVASVYSDIYHCDAVLRSRSVVAQLGKTAFKDRLAGNRTWAENWAAGLAHSVQRARLNAEVRSLRKVSERLDFWQAVTSGNWDDRYLKDIAAEIGVSPEALYREVARRRKSGGTKPGRG